MRDDLGCKEYRSSAVMGRSKDCLNPSVELFERNLNYSSHQGLLVSLLKYFVWLGLPKTFQILQTREAVQRHL